MKHIDVLLIFCVTIGDQTITLMTDGLDVDNDEMKQHEVEEAIVKLPGIAGFSFLKRNEPEP